MMRLLISRSVPQITKKLKFFLIPCAPENIIMNKKRLADYSLTIFVVYKLMVKGCQVRSMYHELFSVH